MNLAMSDKRNELENKAAQSVQKIGLSNLSFRTLADEAGIKSSSVHYYFPEKSHLADALICNYTEQFEKKLAEINKTNASAVKKIESFITIFEEVVNDDKLCLCGMMAAETANLKDHSRTLLLQYFIQVEDWLYKVIKSNKSPLQVDIKPRQFARIIMSGLEGAILIDRVEGKPVRLRAQRELVRKLFS